MWLFGCNRFSRTCNCSLFSITVTVVLCVLLWPQLLPVLLFILETVSVTHPCRGPENDFTPFPRHHLHAPVPCLSWEGSGARWSAQRTKMVTWLTIYWHKVIKGCLTFTTLLLISVTNTQVWLPDGLHLHNINKSSFFCRNKWKNCFSQK